LLGDALNFVIIKICDFHDEVVNAVVLDNMSGLRENVFDVGLT